MKLKNLFIVCLLGDPVLPATSVPLTGGYNVDILELLEFLQTTDLICTVVTNTSTFSLPKYEKFSDNITIHRIHIPEAKLNDQNKIPEFYPQILDDTCDIWNSLIKKPDIIHSYYWLSGKIALSLHEKYGINFIHSAVSLSIDKIKTNATPKCELQFEWEKQFLPGYSASLLTV